jgi:hypothetical protein
MAAWQMSKLDIDARIVAAFGNVKSTDLSTLIEEVEGAALASDQVADSARRRALDPALAPNVVAEARRNMEDTTFRRDRMQTAVTGLKERLREVKALEENERRRKIYERVKAERDSLAIQLKANYPGIENQLGQLITKIEANDREIEFVNAHGLPTGAERLRSAELIARGIEAWRVNQTDVVRITRELCLPAFKHDPHIPYAWPRSR